jgi:hypothetical protein
MQSVPPMMVWRAWKPYAACWEGAAESDGLKAYLNTLNSASGRAHGCGQWPWARRADPCATDPSRSKMLPNAFSRRATLNYKFLRCNSPEIVK